MIFTKLSSFINMLLVIMLMSINYDLVLLNSCDNKKKQLFKLLSTT